MRPVLRYWASLVAQWSSIHLPMQEMWVRSPGREYPLEKKIATHSSLLAWEIPRTEETGGLQFMRSQRVGHDWPTSLSLVAQMVKRLPAVQETWVWSLAWEDPLEKKIATHSSTLALESPWTEGPGGYSPRGSQKVSDLVTKQQQSLRFQKWTTKFLSLSLFFCL